MFVYWGGASAFTSLPSSPHFITLPHLTSPCLPVATLNLPCAPPPCPPCLTLHATLNPARTPWPPPSQGPMVVTGPEDPAVVVAGLRRGLESLQVRGGRACSGAW